MACTKYYVANSIGFTRITIIVSQHDRSVGDQVDPTNTPRDESRKP